MSFTLLSDKLCTALRILLAKKLFVALARLISDNLEIWNLLSVNFNRRTLAKLSEFLGQYASECGGVLFRHAANYGAACRQSQEQ